MKCRKCGRQNPPDARFCSACGTPLRDASGDTTSVMPILPDESESDLTQAEIQATRNLGTDAALLIVGRSGGDRARFLIDSDVTSVGRHPASDIFLDDITVSRHHARFVRSRGVLLIEDHGSLNGTYVNRKLIDGATPLHQGDEIQIGKYRATIHLGEPGQN